MRHIGKIRTLFVSFDSPCEGFVGMNRDFVDIPKQSQCRGNLGPWQIGATLKNPAQFDKNRPPDTTIVFPHNAFGERLLSGVVSDQETGQNTRIKR